LKSRRTSTEDSVCTGRLSAHPNLALRLKKE